MNDLAVLPGGDGDLFHMDFVAFHVQPVHDIFVERDALPYPNVRNLEATNCSSRFTFAARPSVRP